MKLLFDPSPKTFIEAIQPIFVILRLTGLASSSYFTTTTTTTVITYDPYGATPRLIDHWRTGDNRWKLRKPSLLSMSYSLFIALLLIFCFAISQYSKHAMSDVAVPTTLTISDWVTSSLNLFTCLTFVVTLTANRERMSNVFGKMTYVDAHLLNEPASVYARTHLLAWIQVVVLTLVVITMTTIDFINRRTFLGWTRAMLLHSTQPLSLLLDLGLLQFVNIILLLKQRYKILNSLVENFGNSVANLTDVYDAHNSGMSSPDNLRENPSPSVLPVMDLFTSLRTLRKIHFSLHEIAASVNSIHGFPLFSSMLCSFLNITFLSYVCIIHALIHEETMNPTGYEWYMVLSKLLWAARYACAVVFVTAACQVTRDEASRAAILVQGCLLTEGLPVALSRELDRFAKQLSHVRLEFKANGFFQLDLGLLCAMSGAITTYLVILVQIR